MSSEDEDIVYLSDTPEDVQTFKLPHSTYPHGLPPGTLHKYNHTYEHFQKWNKLNGSSPVKEDVLIKFFSELAERSKPTTLWAYFSMLKSTFKSKDEIDISSYSKLIEFLKNKNLGYKPVRAKNFKEEEIEKFINDAPDDYWLDVKAVCIFAVNGVYNSSKLVNVRVEHIKQYDDLALVTIPRTETSAKYSFTITGTFVNIIRKYIALRPNHVKESRLFLRYRDGKCTIQPIGKNKFAKMPRRIAKYLKLPEPERYSGLSFRLTGMTPLNTNASADNNLTNAAQEQRIDNSLEQCNTVPRLVSYPSQFISTSSRPVSTPSSFVSTRSRTNGNTNGYCTNTNANTNNIANGHVCTVSCAQVQCAKEEYETNVFHAFNIMKPPEFSIVEVTCAVFPADPMCRWIVAYTHINEPVTVLNADEAFEDITRSIPNNVRINQKYVRGNSSQVLAAYVVIYSVNCRCHKQSSEIINFTMNEIKCEH